MLRKSNRPIPDWSRKLLAFRRTLKLTQSELGKQLKASAMAISRWERGDNEPLQTYTYVLGTLQRIRSVGFFGDAQA